MSKLLNDPAGSVIAQELLPVSFYISALSNIDGSHDWQTITSR